MTEIMKLHRQARRYASFTLTGFSGYEASFDDGATWHALVQVDLSDEWRILVAGPDAEPASAVVLPAGRVACLVRGTDTEAEIEPAGVIEVWGVAAAA